MKMLYEAINDIATGIRINSMLDSGVCGPANHEESGQGSEQQKQ